MADYPYASFKAAWDHDRQRCRWLMVLPRGYLLMFR